MFELILISDAVTLADNLTPYLAIAESIRLDAEQATIVDDSGDLPMLDLPEGPLRASEMPPGVIIFALDVQMPLPEGWSFDDSAGSVNDSAVLNVNGMDALVTVTLSDISGFAGYDDWRAALMMFAGAMFVEADSEPTLLERPDGRTAERLGGGELPVLLYLVDLGGNVGAMINVLPIMNTDADFIASLQASSDAIALEMTRFNRLSAVAEAANGDDGTAVALQMPEATAFLGTFEVDCGSTADTHLSDIGDSAVYVCPADCGFNTAWGTDIYTYDSSVCTAAIHTGLLTRDGGSILVTRIDGQDEYVASERNGISSSGWGSWGGSFFLSAPK